MLTRTSMLALPLAAALVLSSAVRPATGAPAAAPEIFRSLPGGHIVLTVDTKTVLDRAVPAVLANRPEPAKRFEANLAMLREDYGLDLRQTRNLALSASVGADGKLDWTAVLDGAFDALAAPGALSSRLGAYTKRAPQYSVRTETYEGVTFYALPERMPNGQQRERMAVAVLDGQTALVGTPAGIRRAVDVRKGKAPSVTENAALVEAYEQSDAASPIRLGLLIPPSLIEDDPNNPFASTLESIRYVFGSLGVAGDGGVAMRLVSRARTPGDTKNIQNALQSLVDLGRSFTGEKPDLAALVDRITVSSSGSDVTVAADVPAAQIESLVRVVSKQ